MVWILPDDFPGKRAGTQPGEQKQGIAARLIIRPHSFAHWPDLTSRKHPGWRGLMVGTEISVNQLAVPLDSQQSLSLDARGVTVEISRVDPGLVHDMQRGAHRADPSPPAVSGPAWRETCVRHRVRIFVH